MQTTTTHLVLPGWRQATPAINEALISTDTLCQQTKSNGLDVYVGWHVVWFTP